MAYAVAAFYISHSTTLVNTRYNDGIGKSLGLGYKLSAKWYLMEFFIVTVQIILEIVDIFDG